MTPSEFARTEVAALLEKAAAQNVDKGAALRAILDTTAAALAEQSGVEDAQNELTFIAGNLGDDEDHVFMRP
ncbi:MAG: hypothetical protein ACKVH0_17925 [Alphaproteobacteria bacterium]|jgi:hypothetical protein